MQTEKISDSLPSVYFVGLGDFWNNFRVVMPIQIHFFVESRV